jgi:zinc D-Ala-D-Ala carboxypeptidase
MKGNQLLVFVLLSMIIVSCDRQTEKRPGSTVLLHNEHQMLAAYQSDTPALDSLITKAYLLGRFTPETHPLFVRIDPAITTITSGYIRQEVHQAFLEMHRAAARDGIRITIVSATRNFDAQKRIWEGKWRGERLSDGVDVSTIADPVERAKEILKFSSMPGTSRHHWGTDIDINSVSPAYFTRPEGEKVYAWLAANANTYGFCQTYTKKDSLRPTGYEAEPWHWSYTPVSSSLLSLYEQHIKPDDISGFAGAETALALDVIRNYVSGINTHCR